MEEKIKVQIEEILKGANMKLEIEIDFPLYKKLPDEVALAMKIIHKHEIQYRVVVKEIK